MKYFINIQRFIDSWSCHKIKGKLQILEDSFFEVETVGLYRIFMIPQGP